MGVSFMLFYCMPEALKIKEKNLQEQECFNLCSSNPSEMKLFPSVEGEVL